MIHCTTFPSPEGEGCRGEVFLNPPLLKERGRSTKNDYCKLINCCTFKLIRFRTISNDFNTS